MVLTKNSKDTKNIFIVQNTDLGNVLPLSINLTNLLINFVSSPRFNLNLIVSRSESIAAEIEKNFSNIFQIPTSLYSIKGNIQFSLSALKILIRQHRKRRIDIIHCLYPNSSLLAAVLFKSLFNWHVKVIYEVRSPWIEMSCARGHVNRYFAPVYKTILYTEEYLLTRVVNFFIFISDGLDKYYSDKLHIISKNKKVIPTGVDTKQLTFKKENTIREQHGIKDNEILFGVIGTLGIERKLTLLVNALSELLKQNEKYKLMFVGDGSAKKDLERISRNLNIRDNVIFTGRVNHQLASEYISSFDIGICHLPDIFIFRHSSPLKILEYLSCGIPVLATNIMAHQEIADGLKNIYLYNLTVDDFLNSVSSVSLNKPYTGNEEYLKKNYDWNSLSMKYISIYNELSAKI